MARFGRSKFPSKAEIRQDHIHGSGDVNHAVSVYDNGGKTADRYTVVFDDQPERGRGMYAALGLSEHPGNPQGVSEFTTAMKGRHLGKRVQFRQLPAEVQNHVIARLRDT